MPVDDVWQVTNEFEYQGNPNSYNWHLQVSVEGDAEGVGDDMLTFGLLRQTAWILLHNPSVRFLCVTARQLFPTTSLPQMTINDPVKLGNRTCDPLLNHLPGQCSCVVTRYGDKTNPTARNRGRDFVTGACGNDQFNGTFDSGIGSYLEELCTMYANMTNRYVSAPNEYDIGIYSPSNALPPKAAPGDPQPPPIVPYFWPLEFVRGRSLVRTQRRRQPLDPCEIVCDQDILPIPPP